MSTMNSLPAKAQRIPIAEGISLHADVSLPPAAKGIVLFAHGSGSSRHSPRNRYVAGELNLRQLGTVLADLLTQDEERLDERSGALRFDISLLTRRVVAMIDWVDSQELNLPVGLFGASTGAAAALDAAAARPGAIRAVVSRGGRPDLATRLEEVKAPTLLIVGGADTAVLQMNRDALQRLSCSKELEIVPGATHLFDEPGTLEAVATAAGAWFAEHVKSDE